MTTTHIVTGASRGIGRETAKHLAENDLQVLALARSEDKLNELRDEYPGNITAYPIDLLNTEELEGFFDHIKTNDLGVDTLINNAGLLRKDLLVDSSDEDWQLMFDIHVMAPVRLIRGLLNSFSNSAHVVNISSMAGYQGSSKFPGMGAYCTAKGAMATATEALATELTEYSVHCNALCIGAVQTEMLEDAFPGVQAPVSAEQMGRYVADFALNARGLYNGQVLPVNVGDPE